MKNGTKSSWLPYAVAAGATALGVLVRWLLDPWMDEHMPFVTAFGAIAFSVWFGGKWPAILSAATGFVACEILFVEPRGTFALDTVRDVIGLGVYLVTSIVIVGAGEALRSARRRSEEQQRGLGEAVQERLRLLDEQRRVAERLRLLWEAAELLLTTEQPTTMLQGLFAKIAPHFGLDAYLNFVIDENGEGLRLGSCAGVSEADMRKIERLEFGRAICGTVALQRRPIVASFIQRSEDPLAALAKTLGLRAYACNPLLAGQRLLGTLSFASKTRDEFTAEELDFFQTICHYTAAAFERGRLIRELREADQKKDEFLATLAHELRNPLAPIRNAHQLLALQEDTTNDARSAVDILGRQLRQMTRLVDDLLDLSRISRGKINLLREHVTLDRLVGNAVESARPLLEEQGHEFTVTLPPDAMYLDADATRLTQVFLNLLNNAAKYTPAEGRVHLLAEREGSDVVVRVRDSGIGIPREMLPRIFDMFTQVDRSLERTTGGLGIGLTLVRKIVEMHRGRVEAHSDGPGLGSEFVVRLPLVVTALPEQGAAERHEATTPLTNCRILIVDDNRDAADSLAMMLRLQGHDTHTAYDGHSAFEAAQTLQPEVAVLDIGLPLLNGYDLARRIRAQPWGKKILLIALTGWGQEEDQRRAREAGFDQHMIKPADPQTLQSILATLPCS